jgi:hypothetical protein
LKVYNDGTRLYSNFGAGDGDYSSQEDTLNNAEKVTIATSDLTVGTTITVTVETNGLSYADTQKFAVVVTGNVASLAPTPAPTPVPTPARVSKSKNEDLNTGAVAGIVIGVICFFLVVFGVIYWFRTRSSSYAEFNDSSKPNPSTTPAPGFGGGVQLTPPVQYPPPAPPKPSFNTGVTQQKTPPPPPPNKPKKGPPPPPPPNKPAKANFWGSPPPAPPDVASPRFAMRNPSFRGANV